MPQMWASNWTLIFVMMLFTSLSFTLLNSFSVKKTPLIKLIVNKKFNKKW